MRLRKIKGADETVAVSPYVIHGNSNGMIDVKALFETEHSLHLEIGMGKGRFLMTLARQNPGINYVGIERYSSVLIRALQKMETDPLSNLLFLCIDAGCLEQIFAPGEAGRIYLNFSDPWPKDRHARRRLTSPEYLSRYRKVLDGSGHVEFKTDNEALFDFSLESIEAAGWKLAGCTRNLHLDPEMNAGNVMTEYEEKFSAKGNPIYKLIALP